MASCIAISAEPLILPFAGGAVDVAASVDGGAAASGMSISIEASLLLSSSSSPPPRMRSVLGLFNATVTFREMVEPDEEAESSVTTSVEPRAVSKEGRIKSLTPGRSWFLAWLRALRTPLFSFWGQSEMMASMEDC